MVLFWLVFFSSVSALAQEGSVWVDSTSATQVTHSQIAKIAAQAMPAVVYFKTRCVHDDKTITNNGLGTGFVIHPDGFILTNNHVVDGTNEIEALFLKDNGELELHKVKVVGHDTELDVAL